MLQIMLLSRVTITFTDCMTQMYVFGVSETFECFLLTVMSYDRYVAICIPLRYTIIMTSTYCVTLAIVSWLFTFAIMVVIITTILLLNFCGPKIIDHFFCDFLPIMDRSCSDTSIVQLEIYFLSVPIIFIPLIVIIFSYARIIVITLRIPSSTVLSDTFRYLKVSVSDGIGRYRQNIGSRRCRVPIPIQVNGTQKLKEPWLPPLRASASVLKNAVSEGPSMTSRSPDRDVIECPSLTTFSGMEADTRSGDSQGSLEGPLELHMPHTPIPISNITKISELGTGIPIQQVSADTQYLRYRNAQHYL
ncbi:unnamed protein product [Ranitomeya imitator]|uniref:Olfactory receptor n=1 Tax=Ranitomeya imitator TaxID=111125 RepID=A0ABN9M0H2_9NEOB|nr:unnamed protein product [Ranitomeya imitator]